MNHFIALIFVLQISSYLIGCDSYCFSHTIINNHRLSTIRESKALRQITGLFSSTPSKGFGKAKEIIDESEEIKDTGSQTYDIQSRRGVPEYNIFLRPTNGTDGEWVPVGSMTIPRDASIEKAILEVEPQLLKGTFKVFPKLKAFAEFRKDKDTIFEYGYCLKAFPDEPIKLVSREAPEKSGNFFVNWLSKITNPIDTTELKNKNDITFKV